MRPWGWRWYLTLLLGRDGGAERALAHLPLRPGQRVLVLGAAQHHVLPSLRDHLGRDGQIRVLELQWERLLAARRYCRVRSRGIRFRQEPWERVGQQPDRFDVICTWIAPPLPWPVLLAQVARGLRPGGIFSVTLTWPGRGTVLRPRLLDLARRVGLRPSQTWGSPWHYTLHLQKADPTHRTR